MRYASVACFLAASCVSDAELKTCAEFELGTQGCPPPCEVFCSEVTSLCPARFPEQAACQSSCETEIPQARRTGPLEATSGDTLACRLTQAQSGTCGGAVLEPNEVCADETCLNYCRNVLQACPASYSSNLNCLINCQALARGSSADGSATLECRQRYALQAVDQVVRNGIADAEICNHASLGGGTRCAGRPCDVYCGLLEANCPNHPPFESPEQCQSACGVLAMGQYDDWTTDADTLSCRIHHAADTESDEVVHCAHARIYNPNRCGIPSDPDAVGWPCETLCRLIEANCPPDEWLGLDHCLNNYCINQPAIFELEDGQQPAIYPISTLTCP